MKSYKRMIHNKVSGKLLELDAFRATSTAKNRSHTSRHRVFKKLVYDFYKDNRRVFPWRQTTDPYAVLVSEIMLQQTQADRVVPQFTTFIKQFPNLEVLAAAPLSRVIAAWQGLGYNRRARMLHECAQKIIHIHAGYVPSDIDTLTALPGIGTYTAAAVRAFAFNLPAVVLDTNIRSVYIYYFFRHAKRKITDREIAPLVAIGMDTKNPREWYSALMDLGAFLKRVTSNPSKKSATYQMQSAFKGSSRQIRGALLRHIVRHRRSSASEVHADLVSQKLGTDMSRTVQLLGDLVKDSLLKQDGAYFDLP